MAKAELDFLLKLRIWELVAAAGDRKYASLRVSSRWSGQEVSCLVLPYDERPFVHVGDISTGYQIFLTKTACHYGGWRHWFLCPFCGKRAGVLYKGGEKFGCRSCYGLTYMSNRFFDYRLIEWDDKIEARIHRVEKHIKRSRYAGRSTINQRKRDELCKLFRKHPQENTTP